MKLLDKSGQWPLHMDGTYKLTWKAFLVLISSITHAQHWFHPVSLSLVGNEHMSVYMHLFTVTEKAYVEESGHELDHHLLLLMGLQ